uniref:Fungal lipase-type domain-containing protein n=1 Tax=Chromera velia CCMP2878 TaxID=1169474 RepID=A0A0G4H937_9ALVE|eukprot:Cvel_25329.t1-p1 / transcript=Cvel_25329.t1 / gene=Cvel_25329 / organism=Chromera_velia_CCMP2878 / gene_product=hypothetical protein / transcript_product=hypothetical protein / location=Cvel_scaffold2854:5542-7369(+) / protein_length=447 / sequence_SO=supercontig / SO=protein_coding / is_pseudo=false
MPTVFLFAYLLMAFPMARGPEDPRPEDVCKFTESLGHQSLALQMACLARGAGLHHDAGHALGWEVQTVISAGGDVAVISAKEETRECAIAFKGSREFDDWRNNVRVFPLEEVHGPAHSNKTYHVHRGFVNEYRALKETEGWEEWEKLRADRAQCLGGIYLTGHSMGGAIASIHKLEQWGEDSDQATVFTFGAPRAVETVYQDCRGFRYILKGLAGSDAVPGLPRRLVHGHTAVVLRRTLKGFRQSVLDCGSQVGGGFGVMQHRMRAYIWFLYKIENPGLIHRPGEHLIRLTDDQGHGEVVEDDEELLMLEAEEEAATAGALEEALGRIIEEEVSEVTARLVRERVLEFGGSASSEGPSPGDVLMGGVGGDEGEGEIGAWGGAEQQDGRFADGGGMEEDLYMDSGEVPMFVEETDEEDLRLEMLDIDPPFEVLEGGEGGGMTPDEVFR